METKDIVGLFGGTGSVGGLVRFVDYEMENSCTCFSSYNFLMALLGRCDKSGGDDDNHGVEVEEDDSWSKDERGCWL